jgi:hypothetical protein
MKTDPGICRPIVGLLFAGSPPTIIRRIPRLIVVTLYRCATWGFAHIYQEYSKRFSPPWVNFNPAVSLIPWVLWVITTAKHPVPRIVLMLVFGSALTVALPLGVRRPLLSPKAATRLRAADLSFQFGRLCYFLSAAVAAAKPSMLAGGRGVAFSNREPTKTHSNQVFLFHVYPRDVVSCIVT